jgi:hypothetical protein
MAKKKRDDGTEHDNDDETSGPGEANMVDTTQPDCDCPALPVTHRHYPSGPEAIEKK